MRGCAAGPWAGGLAEGGPTQESGRSCPWTGCRECWARAVAGEASVMLACLLRSSFLRVPSPPSFPRGRHRGREEKQKWHGLLCYLNRHPPCRHPLHPRCCLLCAKTPGHVRATAPMPDLPCVYTHAGFLGRFGPMAVYAAMYQSRIVFRRARWMINGNSTGNPAHTIKCGLCMFLGTCAWLCAGWGDLRGNGVDAHAVCTCVLACWRFFACLAALVRTEVHFLSPAWPGVGVVMI